MSILQLRDHAILEDCDVYRGEGEPSALIFIRESGHTHYLAPEDWAAFDGLARSGAAEGEERRMDVFRRIGLLRRAAVDGEASHI